MKIQFEIKICNILTYFNNNNKYTQLKTDRKKELSQNLKISFLCLLKMILLYSIQRITKCKKISSNFASF